MISTLIQLCNHGMSQVLYSIHNYKYEMFCARILKCALCDCNITPYTIHTSTGSVIKKPDSKSDFRDPTRPFYWNDNWYIGVGTGINDASDSSNNKGEFYWYQSTKSDLSQFKLIGSLFNITNTFGMINTSTMVYNPNINNPLTTIECPDIFAMNNNNKIILIANLFVTSQWWIGTININNEFLAENMGLLDYGNFYAGKTGTSLLETGEDNLRYLFGFTGWNEPTAPNECGRSHVIPREVEISSMNTLLFDPTNEISTIRVESSYVHEIVTASSSGESIMLDIKGSELEIIISCVMMNINFNNRGNINMNGIGIPNGTISVNVIVSQDKSEYTQIGYNFDKEMFYSDHSHCCTNNSNLISNIVQIAPYNNSLVMDGIYIHILVDRSVIESFGNHERVITSMISPSNDTLPENRQVIFNSNPSLSCDVQAWNLQL